MGVSAIATQSESAENKKMRRTQRKTKNMLEKYEFLILFTSVFITNINFAPLAPAVNSYV